MANKEMILPSLLFLAMAPLLKGDEMAVAIKYIIGIITNTVRHLIC